MNKPWFSTFLFSGFLTLFLLGGSVTPVSAIAHQPDPVPTIPLLGSTHHRGQPNTAPKRILTFITLQEPAEINLGNPFILSGYIKDQNKKPVANKPILFTIDGKYLGQTRSNTHGFFERKFTNGLDAGAYRIEASSNLTHLLAPATTSTTLKILPTNVRIRTVPPIPGIAFQMNETRFVSGEDGFADIKIDKIGQYRLEVLADQYHNPSKRIEFARWLDESYHPYQDIQVPTDKVIQVGFNVYHLVGQSFMDLDGLPVDPARVKEFTIRSAQGDMFVLHDGQPRWIPASRIARRVNGLEETQLLYSVISVTVDGSNVVNQSQQRFFTYPSENWPISLLLYSMRISAKDGLFDYPVGKSVNVKFPDGHVENYPLDPAGEVEIHSLARGNYITELVGVNGVSTRIPVALSRNQDVTTKVISYLDLAVVGALGVFIALGLLLYGRPSLLHFLRKNNRQTVHETELALSENAGYLYDYRTMRYETLKLLEDNSFEKSTGVDRDLFEKMLAHYQKELRQTGKQPRLSGADQILLTLLFLREHRSEYEIGQIYGVSASTVRRTIKKVKNTMVKSDELNLSGKNLLQPRNSLIDIDLIQAPEPRMDGTIA